MNKILLLIGVCTFAVSSYAQDKGEQVRVGLKAGFNGLMCMMSQGIILWPMINWVL